MREEEGGPMREAIAAIQVIVMGLSQAVVLERAKNHEDSECVS